MTIYIWTIVVLLVVETLAKILLLSVGKSVPRTPAGLAWDVAIGIGFICWGLWLLAKGA